MVNPVKLTSTHGRKKVKKKAIQYLRFLLLAASNFLWKRNKKAIKGIFPVSLHSKCDVHSQPHLHQHMHCMPKAKSSPSHVPINCNWASRKYMPGGLCNPGRPHIHLASYHSIHHRFLNPHIFNIYCTQKTFH